MLETGPSPRLRLVVPCYNEEGRLSPAPFLEFLASRRDTTLLFVDDGSTDGTANVLASLAGDGNGRIETLTLPRNGGKAAAVRQGVLTAVERGTELVGYWDSDLATPLDAVPSFIDVLDANDRIQIVVGSRVKLLGRHVTRSAARHYVGRVFATAASLVLGLPVYDTQCGAKIFRASEGVVQAFRAPFRSSWVFDVEILARYTAAVGRERAEASIYELPLTTWHDVPGSKVRLWHGVQAAWDLAQIRGWTRRAGVGR